MVGEARISEAHLSTQMEKELPNESISSDDPKYHNQSH